MRDDVNKGSNCEEVLCTSRLFGGTEPAIVLVTGCCKNKDRDRWRILVMTVKFLISNEGLRSEGEGSPPTPSSMLTLPPLPCFTSATQATPAQNL